MEDETTAQLKKLLTDYNVEIEPDFSEMNDLIETALRELPDDMLEQLSVVFNPECSENPEFDIEFDFEPGEDQDNNLL